VRRTKSSGNVLSCITLLGLLSGLTACGKSEQEEACDQADAGNFVILNGIKCIFGSTDNGVTKGSDSGTTSLTTNDYQTSEYEPNDSLGNANLLGIDVGGTPIFGQLEKSVDLSDNFIFSPPQSGDYDIFLCADTCDSTLHSDVLTLMLLDQSQTTIAATPIGMQGEQSMSRHLHAGLAYYIEVSTLAATAAYRLMIVRKTN